MLNLLLGNVATFLNTIGVIGILVGKEAAVL
jgi:hypothetical protein